MRTALKELLKLAAPVILAELGWMFMGVVDTIMVGPLGPEAIGGVSVGHIFVDLAAIVGIGLLLGLDTLVSQAYGAGRYVDCDHSLWQGLYLAAFYSPVGMLAVYATPLALQLAGVQPVVVELAIPYAFSLQWSIPPLMVYAAFRRYLQGMSLVRPVMFALVTANLVNWVGNMLLIPTYGVEGSGWATVAARVYMAGFLVTVALRHRPELIKHRQPPTMRRIRELLSLGVPASGQILMEMGVFAASTLLAGRLTPEALAAHHVLLNIAGTTFMIPLGISSAAAVGVGHGIGSGQFRQAKRMGWLAIAMGSGFMLLASVVLLVIPERLIGIFTSNAKVFAVATPLLAVAALFQTFDGLQVVTTGALRGAGDTRTPMLVNLMGHWLLGLPVGYSLCFIYGYGVVGLWIGLSVGLTAVGSVLLAAWARLPLHSRASLPQQAVSL